MKIEDTILPKRICKKEACWEFLIEVQLCPFNVIVIMVSVIIQIVLSIFQKI